MKITRIFEVVKNILSYGGGISPLKSNNYRTKTSKFLLKNLFSKINFKQQSKGAILIEFAFCMPVLILLIYYVYDLCLLNRYNYLTKFATYQAIQMIQSVTQNRTDKRLTKADFDRIGKAAMLCMPVCLPPGLKSVYNNIGFSYSLNCAYVQGVGKDRCKVLWTIYADIIDYGASYCFSEGTAGNRLTPAWAFTLQSRYNHPETIGQEVNSTALWSDLHINNGEKKAIIEVTLYARTITGISNLVGLLLLKVPGYKGHGRDGAGDPSPFFPSHTIFYPNLGVFTDTPPQ